MESDSPPGAASTVYEIHISGETDDLCFSAEKRWSIERRNLDVVRESVIGSCSPLFCDLGLALDSGLSCPPIHAPLSHNVDRHFFDGHC